MRFKTSFGQGTFAKIPWLACFAPGQLASLEGVYPVLLYQLDGDLLSVAYGVSATAEIAPGNWPRRWPPETTETLQHFTDRKYAESFVFRQFASPSATAIDDITECFLNVITDFMTLLRSTPLLPTLDHGTVANFSEVSVNAGMVLNPKLARRLLAALGSKRLCILTGLAGSGKTKLAEAMAI